MSSRSTSQPSSAYFQSGSFPQSCASRSTTGRPRPDTSGAETHRTHQYSQSIASTRPGTSYASTSRPGTTHSIASGRKSRATTASSILGLTEAHSIVCAISEARGVSPSVGLAFVNVSLGEVTLSQICDNQSYVKTIHKIQMASPSRIVFMSTICPPSNVSTLYDLIEELVPDAQRDVAERATWSENAGLDYIQTLAFDADVAPIKVAILGKYYAVTSLSAALKFIENNFSISFAPHSLRIRYQPSEDTMMIDISAIRSLEIMRNSISSKSKDSLFGLLNHTLTPMGSRILRNNILQPSTRPDTFIYPRYDALEELTTNEEMFREIRKALKPFLDVEKVLTKLIIVSTAENIHQVDEQLGQILMLKSFLQSVPRVFKALGPAQSALLVKIRDMCHPNITVPILKKIQEWIEPDVVYMKSPLDLRNQRTFAVKSGISSMLDVARQTYKELTEEIHRHVDNVQNIYEVNATLKFDNGRKYWLRLKTTDFDENPLPVIFINVIRKKANIECQTMDLVKLNMRLSDTSNEVVIRSDDVVQRLTHSLRQETAPLFRVCESLALLDMIASFGQLVTTRDYVRPEITDTFALKAARHPILDKTMGGDFVPNDYYATEQYCFHTVTGCNMSGKTTYIRAVPMLQIMAQIGCFVPAEYASFTIIHTIFARVSTNDNLEACLSTFGVEMREMAFMLRNIDEKSLAVIDELGRGTGTVDGLSMALAMAEALVESKASVWFATHFVDIARVLGDQPGVLNLHLATECSTNDNGHPDMTMTYKAAAGMVDDTMHYGINLARAMGFPESFTKKAEEVSNDLRRKREAKMQTSESRKLVARRKLILNLYDALQQAKEHGSEKTLPAYLRRLQEEFILRMAEVENM